MPTLDQLGAVKKVDLLNAGESGSGKTGALASLVDAGWILRILDFDKGVRSIAGYAKKKALLSNVFVKQISDAYQSQRPTPVRGASAVMAMGLKKATAFMDAMAMLDNWKEDDGTSFGAVETWDDNVILVIDSLSFAAVAALNLILMMNGRMNTNPEQSDYHAAQQTIERMIARLTSDAVRCHVLVNTHIDLRGQEGASQQRAYPMVLGKALSPKIGTFFNNLVASRTTVTGKREIMTRVEGLLACKVSVPGIPAVLPVETGLADLFDYLLGRKVPPAPSAAAPASRQGAAGPTPAPAGQR